MEKNAETKDMMPFVKVFGTVMALAFLALGIA